MRTFLKAAMLAATLSTAAISASAAFADPTGPVLSVDIARVFTDSAAGKSGNAQIRTKYEGALQGANTSFNSAATSYNAQVEAARKVAKPDGSIPPVNQQSLQRAQQAVQQADSSLSRMQDEVNAVGSYVQRQILEKVTPLAEQVRGERKAALVVPRGSVLAVDPTGDITAVIIQRLDQQLPTVSIALPQQGATSGARSGTAPAPRTAPSQGR